MPLFFIKEVSSSIKVGLWKIEENIAFFEQLINLSDEEKALYDSFRTETRKIQWLSYRLLIKEMIGKNISVQYDNFGKPYLINNKPYISVSHTGCFAALITNANHHTGIDIEIINQRIEKISHKFLNDNEQNDCINEPIGKKFVFWSAKEAIYKLYGSKFLSFKNEINIQPFKYSTINEGYIIANVSKAYYTKSFQLCYQHFNDLLLVYVVKEIF